MVVEWGDVFFAFFEMGIVGVIFVVEFGVEVKRFEIIEADGAVIGDAVFFADFDGFTKGVGLDKAPMVTGSVETGNETVAVDTVTSDSVGLYVGVDVVDDKLVGGRYEWLSKKGGGGLAVGGMV